MLIVEDLKISKLRLEGNMAKKVSFNWLRSFVKKTIVKLGLYGFYRLFKRATNIDQLFNTSSFKYGGERVAIRCVFKKRS